MSSTHQNVSWPKAVENCVVVPVFPMIHCASYIMSSRGLDELSNIFQYKDGEEGIAEYHQQENKMS